MRIGELNICSFSECAPLNVYLRVVVGNSIHLNSETKTGSLCFFSHYYFICISDKHSLNFCFVCFPCDLGETRNNKIRSFHRKIVPLFPKGDPLRSFNLIFFYNFPVYLHSHLQTLSIVYTFSMHYVKMYDHPFYNSTRISLVWFFNYMGKKPDFC